MAQRQLSRPVVWPKGADEMARGGWGDVERAARCNQIGRGDCKTILSAGINNETLDDRWRQEGLPGKR